MTTRMIHPEHGATHAYGQVDIEWHQKNGWAIESEAKLLHYGPVPEAKPIPNAVGEPLIVPLQVLDEPPRRRILKVKK
jgi:hypothetical protein